MTRDGTGICQFPEKVYPDPSQEMHEIRVFLTGTSKLVVRKDVLFSKQYYMKKYTVFTKSYQGMVVVTIVNPEGGAGGVVSPETVVVVVPPPPPRVTGKPFGL